MASLRPLQALARTRPAASSLLRTSVGQHHSPAAAFSTSFLRAALPAGPPPVGFRIAKPARWDTDKESALDKAGKYFLMTELLRGMWVVLEQMFRPP